MPYRDDLDAATARRDALARELAAVQARLTDHAPLQARARELTDELAEVSRGVEHARRRVALPLLGAPTISTPCKEPWDRMTGTDQVRFCGRCEKDVYNLSAMTAIEAEALLRARGAGMCARFYQRPDGTLLTSDCPVGARRRRRRRLVVTAVAAAAGALGVAWMLTERDGDDPGTSRYVDAVSGATEQASEPPPAPHMGGVQAWSEPAPQPTRPEERHLPPHARAPE